MLNVLGGRHVAHYVTKSRKGSVCGDCGTVLLGIRHMSTSEFHTAKSREKTVSRAYGGTRCGTCVKQRYVLNYLSQIAFYNLRKMIRIVRAFLIEEQKIVKKVLAAKKAEKVVAAPEPEVAAPPAKKSSKK